MVAEGDVFAYNHLRVDHDPSPRRTPGRTTANSPIETPLPIASVSMTALEWIEAKWRNRTGAEGAMLPEYGGAAARVPTRPWAFR